MLTGSASILLDALKIGATGSICALANILGSDLIQTFDLFNSKQEKLVDKAQIIQNRLIPIDYAVKEILILSI